MKFATFSLMQYPEDRSQADVFANFIVSDLGQGKIPWLELPSFGLNHGEGFAGGHVYPIDSLLFA